MCVWWECSYISYCRASYENSELKKFFWYGYIKVFDNYTFRIFNICTAQDSDVKSIAVLYTRIEQNCFNSISLCVVWEKLKDAKNVERWAAEVEEEFEDTWGNVVTKKTYEDLRRQGLLWTMYSLYYHACILLMVVLTLPWWNLTCFFSL